MQQRTEVVTRRKEMGSKRGRDITLRSRHKIETCEGRRPTQSRPGKERSKHEVILQTERWSQLTNGGRNSETRRRERQRCRDMKPWSRHKLWRNTEQIRSRLQTMSRPLIHTATRNLVATEIMKSRLNKSNQGKSMS